MSLQNHQEQEYSPENGSVFKVKSYWVPANQFHLFEIPEIMRNLKIDFQRINDGRAEILFLVHPESETFYQKFVQSAARGPDFEATATSSSRTLMLWPEGQQEKVFFGKLSLDKEIGGVVRTIPAGEVARSVGVSKIFETAQAELPKDFAYLPEFFGAMPRGWERGGMLLRALPPDIKSGARHVMPLFALYTSPESGVLSPIESMLKQSGMKAKEFVFQKILKPFLDQWVELAFEHGITMEAHAQNVLMEIGHDGLPTGKFVHRDFGGFNINLQFRRNQRLAMPDHLPVITNEEKDYHQRFHQEALTQSLSVFFQGGFLYGLGNKLSQLGHQDVSYQDLQDLVQAELKIQLRARRVTMPGEYFQKIIDKIKNFSDYIFSSKDRRYKCSQVL